MILIALVFGSCQKDKLVQDVTGNSFIRATAGLREFYDNGGTDYGCRPVEVNCHPDDIIINGSGDIAIMNGILNTIIGGNSSSIIAVFTNNRLFLLNYGIDVQDVDGVINGFKTVNVKGSSTSQTRFMRFYANGQINFVYPIRNL